MSDCANVAMREMLPEYLHDRLDESSRAAVEAHLLTCSDCAAELETLRAVRSAFGGVRGPNVASIVAALPKPQSAPRARPVRRLIPWQLAAALAVATVGGLSFAVAQHFGEQHTAVAEDSLPVREAPSVVTMPPVAPRTVDTPRPRAVTPPPSRSAGAEARGGLAVNAGIDELNAEQIEALIRSLDELEAAPAAEPARGARLPVRSELQ